MSQTGQPQKMIAEIYAQPKGLGGRHFLITSIAFVYPQSQYVWMFPNPITQRRSTVRTHNHGLFFRLDDRDYRKLKDMAAESRLQMSTVIRKLISNNVIKASPSADCWKLYKEIEKCRQILDTKCVKSLQCNECPQCKEALKECNNAWLAVFNAFLTGK